MYSTKGSCLTWVGFLGYGGGFDASEVREDNDLASMAGVDDIGLGGRRRRGTEEARKVAT